MNDLFAFILTLLGIGLLISPIFGIVAYLRTRRLHELENRMRGLEQRLFQLGSESSAEPTTTPERTTPRPLPSTLERPAAAMAPPVTERPAPVAEAPSATSDDPPALEEDFEDRFGPKPGLSRLKGIEWERWLGIRGAAILGGIALALAGLLFFQYAIDHGWFGPELRVACGALFGIGCLIVKEPLQRRGYRVTGDVLTGAGAVLLYGAAWSGYKLFDLFPLGIAFAWMVAVTAVVCVLSVRHDSQIIAVFGLVGGFATPLLLSSGEDRPIGLFGYVLLLDLGLLAIGRKQGWKLLPALALIATSGMQGLWIFNRMDGSTATLGLGILGVFALLFAFAVGDTGTQRAGLRRLEQLGSLLIPLLFAAYFSSRVELGEHLYPLAILLGALGAAACWLDRKSDTPLYPFATALGSLAVIATWISRSKLELALQWEYFGVATGLTLVYLAFALLAGKRAETPDAGSLMPVHQAPVGVLGIGLIAVFVSAAFRTTRLLELWPMAAGCAALTLAVGIGTRKTPNIPALALAGIASGLAAGAYAARHLVIGAPVDEGAISTFAGIVAAGAALFLVTAFVSRARSGLGARWAALGAAGLCVPALVALAPWNTVDPTLYLGLTLALTVCAAIGAAGSGFGLAYIPTVIAGAFAAQHWSSDALNLGGNIPPVREVFAWHAAIVAVLAWMPFALRRTAGASRLMYAVASATPLLFFSPLTLDLYKRAYERPGIGLVLAGLALLAGIGLWLEHVTRGPDAEDARPRTGRTAFAGVTALLAAYALPLEWKTAWPVVGAAVTGALWALLAWRLESRPLAIASRIAVTFSAVVLCVLALLPRQFVASDSWFLNEVSYAYFLPALCYGVAVVCLRRLGSPRFAALTGFLLVLTVFAWINLEVSNAYTTGQYVSFQSSRMAARDLTQSLAWTVYSFVLLTLGTARRIDGLRWMSLGFLLLTIAKVFLYDLGELEGLHRVASLLGLAVCLLVVSLLYQRFVFRKPVEST